MNKPVRLSQEKALDEEETFDGPEEEEPFNVKREEVFDGLEHAESADESPQDSHVAFFTACDQNQIDRTVSARANPRGEWLQTSLRPRGLAMTHLCIIAQSSACVPCGGGWPSRMRWNPSTTAWLST